MEKDDEISGNTGSHYTAEFWMYDSRIGKRWNIDPVFKEWETPYASFANNPVINIDPFGSNTINFNNITHSTKDSDGDTHELGKKFNISVIQCEGEDVFLWNDINVVFDGNEEKTETETTEIKPFDWNHSGITKSPGLFGLYSQSDLDNVTLGKLMVANPKLSDYLISKDEKYKFYKHLGNLSNLQNNLSIVADFMTMNVGIGKPTSSAPYSQYGFRAINHIDEVRGASGLYIFADATNDLRPYVGKSNTSVYIRLMVHRRKGRIGGQIYFKPLNGTTTYLEVQETIMINNLGGLGATANERLPISILRNNEQNLGIFNYIVE